MDKIRVIKINIGENTRQHGEARRESARLWNRLVILHKYCRKRHWPWPGKHQLQAHFKGRFKLHSQSIQGIIDKFSANIDSTRSKRKEGDKKARYPWRDQKRYQVVPWKGQSIKRKGNRLTLPMGRNSKPIRIKVPDEIPSGKIVGVELGFRELRITLKEPIKAAASAGANTVAGDPGIIHQMMLTDGKASTAIVGRGLRSLIQGKNRALAFYSAELSKTKKGSRKNRKLRRSKARMLAQFERRQRNLLHHSANKILDFCVEREAGTLVVGDIANIAKNKRKKNSRQSNQENSNSPIGKLYQYLAYKGKLRGVELVKINEAYTSQTCPVCGHRHKPTGRIYRCKSKTCDFIGVRDEVGAANILNKHLHDGKIEKNTILPSGKVKYLRPVKLASRPGVDRLTGGTLPNATPCSVTGVSTPGSKEPLSLNAVA